MPSTRLPTSDRRRELQGDDESLAQLALNVMNEVTTLVHTEFKLLRTEIGEKLAATGISAGLIAAGALLVSAALILLLQAAVAALVAYGLSWTAGFLIVAGATLVMGGAFIWAGVNGLRSDHLAPSKTLHQLHKDATVAQGKEP